MNPNDLKDRIKQFAHRSVKLSSALPATPLGKHIRLQLIKCSTSAAANYRAACIAQSRPSFCSKLSIVVEETDESCFWMEFIITEKLLDPEKVADLLDEGRELTAIFVASRKTANNRSSEFIAAGQTIVNYNSR